MRALAITLLSLSLAVPMAVQARSRTAPIKNPVVVTDTGKASAAQFKMAATLAVLNRGWVMDKKSGNNFEAVYAKEGRSTFEVRIRVSVEGKTATVEYVSSEGLDYADGAINANYNKWMDYIERDIPTFVDWVMQATP